MIYLNLRGQGLPRPSEVRPIKAVLFDKDGTMSHSEPMLTALAESRILHCLEQTVGSAALGDRKNSKIFFTVPMGSSPTTDFTRLASRRSPPKITT